MKQSNWLSFLLGALAGAGITWLFTSKEGKAWLAKMQEKGSEWKRSAFEELEALKQHIENQTPKS